MPTCTVCAHDDREAIDHALVGNGRSLRDIAGRYGVSKSALGRHKKRCLPAKLTKAQEAEEAAEADDLLRHMRVLQTTTLRILRDAEADGERGAALRAVREARANVELLAEMRGELARQGTVNVQVDQLQAVVLDALEDRPDAKAAVARALYEADTDE